MPAHGHLRAMQSEIAPVAEHHLCEIEVLPCELERVQIRGDILTGDVIGAHRQRERSLGIGKAPGALKNASTQMTKRLKVPECGALWGRSKRAGFCHHLQFTTEVVRKHGRGSEEVIAHAATHRDVIEMSTNLGFAYQ